MNKELTSVLIPPPGNLLRLPLLLCCLLPLQCVAAPTSQELRHLIFEPVALAPAATPSSAEPGLTEVTRLPAGPGAAEPTAYVQRRRQENGAPAAQAEEGAETTETTESTESTESTEEHEETVSVPSVSSVVRSWRRWR